MTDLFRPTPPPADDDEKPGALMRIAAFAGLSLGGLIVTAAAAYLLRALILM